MKIETVTPGLFEHVLPLIADYQRFYEAEPDEERNRRFFGQFVDDHRHGILFLALDDTDTPLGFATLYFPFTSISASVICLMNDLFVVSAARGQGVGRTLISHCRNHARNLGFPQLRWLTYESNTTAQQLYDKTGASQTALYRYVLSTSPE